MAGKSGSSAKPKISGTPPAPTPAALPSVPPGAATPSAAPGPEQVPVEFAEDREKLHAAAEARAKQYGIPVLAGGHLVPPAEFPKDASAYADPVNYMYPVHDKAHADNAHARFAQFSSHYPGPASKVVLDRIVAAQKKFGTTAQEHTDATPAELPYDDGGGRGLHVDKPVIPAIEMDGMQPKPDCMDDVSAPDPAAGPMGAAEDADEEAEEQRQQEEISVLLRCLYQMLAAPDMHADDRACIEEMADTARGKKMPPVSQVQRARGIAASHGIGWPSTAAKPAGMPHGRGGASPSASSPQPMHSSYAEGRQAVKFFRSLDNRETFNVPDVEIFATGTWKGIVWTLDDLVQLAENCRTFRHLIVPMVKVGHDNAIAENSAAAGELGYYAVDPSLFGSDSIPALGVVSNLRVRRYTDQHGQPQAKLLADFAYVPKVLRDLIKEHAYTRVSAEIFEDFTDPTTGKQHGRVLRAVALLGAAVPEVKTLEDVTLLYGEARPRTLVVCAETGGQKVNEAELKAKIAALEASHAKMLAETERMQASARSQAAASRRAQVTAFTEAQVREGKITPAVVEKLRPLLEIAGKMDEAVDFAQDANTVKTFSEARGAKTLVESLCEFVAAMPKVVALDTEFAAQPEAPAPGGHTPGAPRAPQKAPVKMGEDGKGRKHPIRGHELVPKIKERQAEHARAGRTISFADCAAEIEKEAAVN